MCDNKQYLLVVLKVICDICSKVFPDGFSVIIRVAAKNVIHMVIVDGFIFEYRPYIEPIPVREITLPEFLPPVALLKTKVMNLLAIAM